VDANAPKDHLLTLAKKLGVSGRSKMKKKELVEAIQKANNKKTADARKT
jgi:transcription termination factor Rho